MRSCLALLAAIVALAACSSGSGGSAAGEKLPTPAAAASTGQQPAVTTTPATAAPAPSSPPTAASPGSSLVLSGALSGRSNAMHSTGICAATAAGYAAQLVFAVSDQAYNVTIEIFDYHGADRYSVPPERISVRRAGAADQPLYPALSGTVTIDRTGRSGSIDVSLGVPGGASQLTGTWAC